MANGDVVVLGDVDVVIIVGSFRSSVVVFGRRPDGLISWVSVRASYESASTSIIVVIETPKVRCATQQRERSSEGELRKCEHEHNRCDRNTEGELRERNSEGT